MSDIIVVKCGGTAAVDSAAVCADVAAVAAAGRRVVLVHGGSAQIDAIAARLGVAQRRITAPDGSSTRYTDPATIEVVLLALAGAVKPRLVAALAGAGVPAVGLTGLDAGLIVARRHGPHRAVIDGRTRLVRDNHTGRIVEVHTELLRTLLDAGTVPVVSPPALGLDGEPVNVDADRVAAAVAAALGARSLLLLTGAPGVLADPADERTLRDVVTLPPDGGPPAGVRDGATVKLLAARDALHAGVGHVMIADGRGHHPVRAALDGAGTRVRLSGATVPA
ncbi:[LysW]-aminoadipate kinase [Micromonospora sp. WMMD1076]|uniref:[LysW]-aminoadipate kinase n=1 Tax=Micromonospora sp. WMMD1076 TaxID=3016103 RepID=UPI00249B1233|nr:[LysW]-aminoadipate kinase [Micromonospora sp. WMMD1076]WFF05891.1 [LysW]-aminoadipate kinase [Micromonospora sp. WMMD1076]